jgi:hypothetical protein
MPIRSVFAILKPIGITGAYVCECHQEDERLEFRAHPRKTHGRRQKMTRSYRQMAQEIAAKALDSDINLDENERFLSAVGGGALLLTTANLRSVRGLLATAVGASLVYRGITGHCPFYSIFGMRTCPAGSKRSTWTGSSARGLREADVG